MITVAAQSESFVTIVPMNPFCVPPLADHVTAKKGQRSERHASGTIWSHVCVGRSRIGTKDSQICHRKDSVARVNSLD